MSSQPRDHRDMLQHVEAPVGREPVLIEKPDWIVHDAGDAGVASTPATPLDVKKKQLGDLLVHNAHTPSSGSFTPTPAPYREDGASVWKRDGTAKKKMKLCYPDDAAGTAAATDSHSEEEEEEEAKENDERWNIKRRSPVKSREGEFEKDFRSRKSYSGKSAESEEEEERKGDEEQKDGEEKQNGEEEEQKETDEKEKEEEQSQSKPGDTERKIKVPKHLVSGPLW